MFSTYCFPTTGNRAMSCESNDVETWKKVLCTFIKNYEILTNFFKNENEKL